MKGNKGFAAVAVLVGILILAGIAAAGWYVVSQNSDEETDVVASTSEPAGDEAQSAEDLEAQAARDTRRRTDIALLVAAVNEYVANNNGSLPPADPDAFSGRFALDFFNDNPGFDDPATGSRYVLGAVDSSQTNPELRLGDIHYKPSATCVDGEFSDGGARQAALRTLLESGESLCVST